MLLCILNEHIQIFCLKSTNLSFQPVNLTSVSEVDVERLIVVLPQLGPTGGGVGEGGVLREGQRRAGHLESRGSDPGGLAD